MSKNSEKVKTWRQRFKQRIIDSMGSQCQICKYSACNAAMEFHHIVPNEKEMSISSILANPKSWKEIVVPELRKCILLCCRCHREIHAGIISLPENFAKFDEKYLNYSDNNDYTSPCPCCEKLKPSNLRYCSFSCSSKMVSHADWESIDLQKLIDDGKTYTEIANMLNCSTASVSKRVKKLGFPSKQKSIIWPTNDELQKLVWTKPLFHLAKDIGVSDKGLKKRCLKLKIQTPPIGYWSK